MKSRVQLLRMMNLPVFSNGNELSSLMHIESGKIDILKRDAYKFYKKYKIKKKDGRSRQIMQPNKDLKAIQAWFLRNILDKLSPSQFATAYISKKNIFNNVYPHVHNRYFMCLDIEDFFPSISYKRVTNIFSIIGYSKAAAVILAKLCTSLDGLPQGAVTSPSISNLISAKLDRRIAGYTARRNIEFTRYADDITLSSNNPIVLCKAMPMIIKIIKSEHFIPNMNKFRILGPKKRCLITGLIKNNSESKFGIGREKKRHMRAVMHNFILNKKMDAKYGSVESIMGWLNYVKSVDKESFESMNTYWNQLIEKYKDKSNIRHQ